MARYKGYYRDEVTQPNRPTSAKMSDDPLDVIPISSSPYRIPKEKVSDKDSYYTSGGFAHVYRAKLAKANGKAFDVALKELQKPIASKSEEKVLSSPHNKSVLADDL